MKTKIKLPAIFIFIAFMFLITNSCNGRKKNTQPPLPIPPKPVPVVTSPTLTKADLTILSVKLEKAGNADKNTTHLLIVTVRNNGDTVARGFNGGCTYDCSGGLVKSGGANVVQGGYIAGNSEIVYKAPFRISCAGPPAFLNLKFVLDPENKVIESNEKNNTKNIKVAVPF